MVRKGQLSGYKNPFFGKHHSDETKKKISLANSNRAYSEETHKMWREQRKGSGNPNYGKRHKWSEETKLKMSVAHKGKVGIKSFLGKHHNEETKQKISVALKGRLFSEEHRKNMSLSQKGKKRYHMWTPEARKKISMIHKGKLVSIETRKKLSINRQKQVFPKKDTKPEVRVQELLQKSDTEFIKHKYIDIEHGYQVDIFVPSLNLVIECDGDYTHCNPKKYDENFIRYPSSKKKITAKQCWEIDRIRTQELIDKGFKVLRLWESEIHMMSSHEQLFERINSILC